ncbi:MULTISPECIES: hypothetical protein [Desulfococcus]|jgi:hypothetical protein|uniref:PilZ domain-containing protein n=1 Tax=Desulfococcus multivorans DSM 2059 TaxID=1121405 RepID=S7TZ09_DESML|nr:hypothetical protein [Desulfococcus multivorans]AOY57346.1 uncharacterized protein Dmul_05710 [Desulfococcus multivorans]AQU99792.1 hypothetical protein B2D07_02720 [Desulfococcus multivorans]EPR41975.1 hypothetical protein dsmv_1702 [Desulfococcus multivorans DSM 2059]MDX9819994.1 hypothetical protein [Desulfococcus multivorans]SKA10741.1 hypothetical protein SAMN02745446_02814 [Desulfococcus multivorans DSM 2059]
MTGMTHRTFPRGKDRYEIRFAENMSAAYQKGELIEKSSGGMSFFSTSALKPGSGILIELTDPSTDADGSGSRPDYLAEVRWCLKEDAPDDIRYRVGVRLFISTCALCGKEIRRRAKDDVDLCEACRSRLCDKADGTVKACIEKYLIGNVV